MPHVWNLKKELKNNISPKYIFNVKGNQGQKPKDRFCAEMFIQLTDVSGETFSVQPKWKVANQKVWRLQKEWTHSVFPICRNWRILIPLATYWKEKREELNNAEAYLRLGTGGRQQQSEGRKMWGVANLKQEVIVAFPFARWIGWYTVENIIPTVFRIWEKKVALQHIQIKWKHYVK